MAEHGGFGTRVLGVFALTAVASGCTPMDDVLQGWFGRSMRVQTSVGAYEHPLPPPEGSVPFAAGNFPAAPWEVNLGEPQVAEIPAPVTVLELIQQAPVVEGLLNPVQANAASLARGEVLFNRACSPCHGPGGDGMGPVVSAGVPSISLVTPQARAYPDGYIYTIIRIGRGGMPPYAHQLAHYDRWHIVNYVRQLQGPPPANPSADDEPVEAQVGAQIQDD